MAGPGYPTQMRPPQQNMQMDVTPQTYRWSSGLFDCTNDIPSCIITSFCPHLTFGKIADIVDQGSTTCGMSASLYFLVHAMGRGGALYSCFYRAKMRRLYNLAEDELPDLLVHAFCEPCALCQMYRELKNLGFNMDIGWHGNVELQTPGAQNAPVVVRGMSR